MKYVILKGCAGLGNRFITLMKAVQYARLSGRRLCVDWCDGMFGAVGENVFERYFTLDFPQTALKEEVMEALRKGASTYPRCLTEEDLVAPIYPESKAEANFRVYTPKAALKTVYKVGLSVVPLHKLVYVLGLQSFQRKEKMEGMTWWKMVSTMGDGRNFPLGSNLWPWLSEDIVVFADFRPLISMKHFADMVVLRPEFQAVVDRKAAELGLDKAIGVHVRYTDKKPTAKLNALMTRLQSLVDEGNRVFLCTDNADVEQEFRERYKERVVMTEKFIPDVKEGGIHIWASKQNDDRLKRQMFEDSLTDMWLLARCRRLYWQGNSSFSYISSLLMNDKTRCVNWLKLK